MLSRGSSFLLYRRRMGAMVNLWPHTKDWDFCVPQLYLFGTEFIGAEVAGCWEAKTSKTRELIFKEAGIHVEVLIFFIHQRLEERAGGIFKKMGMAEVYDLAVGRL